MLHIVRYIYVFYAAEKLLFYHPTQYAHYKFYISMVVYLNEYTLCDLSMQTHAHSHICCVDCCYIDMKCGRHVESIKMESERYSIIRYKQAKIGPKLFCTFFSLPFLLFVFFFECGVPFSITYRIYLYRFQKKLSAVYI